MLGKRFGLILLALAALAVPLTAWGTGAFDRLRNFVYVGDGTTTQKTISFDVNNGASNPTITGNLTGNTVNVTPRLGIGNTSAAVPLDIDGNNGAFGAATESIRLRAGNTNTWLSSGVNSSSRYAWIRAYENGTGENSLLLQPNGGSVGIGTLTPVNNLDVNGSVAFGTYSGTAAPSNGLIVSGNVGIGSSAPTVKLDVTGTVKATTGTAGAPAYQINSGDGMFGAAGSVRFATSGTTRFTATSTELNILDIALEMLNTSTSQEVLMRSGNGGGTPPSVGTASNDDFVIIADGIERVRALAAGGVTITGSNGGGNTPHACTVRNASWAALAPTVTTVTCSTGEIATGGGCQSNANGTVLQAWPASATQWSCGRNATSDPGTVYAICCQY